MNFDLTQGMSDYTTCSIWAFRVFLYSGAMFILVQWHFWPLEPSEQFMSPKIQLFTWSEEIWWFLGPGRVFLFFCNFISKLLKILLKIIDRISPLQPSVMRGMQSQVIGSHLNSCKKNNIIVPNCWRLVISPHFRGPRISVFGGMTGSRLMNMSLAWKLQIPTRHIPSWPATERGMPRRSSSTATGRRSISHRNSSSLELVVA